MTPILGLELDLETHRYTRGGVFVPGVSQIIAGLNLVDASRFTDFARERGTAVHAAVEIHLNGGLAWETVDPRIQGYVTAAVNFLNDAGVKPEPGTYIERCLWHPLHGYAGTPDIVAIAFGQPSIIDLKSGGLGVVGLQTAAYELLARVAYPLQDPKGVRRRMAVQLLENGTYKKTDCADGFDYSNWASAVSLYNRFIAPRVK